MDSLADRTDELLVVIVLYRTTLPESNSYLSILEGFRAYARNGRRIDLVVVNNGPHQITCQTNEDIFRFHYVEQLDNPGVSKAYNVAAGLADRLGKRWLLILDQDTQLPPDFWFHYRRALDQYPDAPVYAPRLRTDGLLASPCGYRYYRGYVLPDLAGGISPMQGHNVLNSGLLVSVEAFRRVGGYDESVQLYFSDFVFFDRLKRTYSTFVVVDLDLTHDLSSSDYSDQITAMDRFSLYCRGAYAAAKHEWLRSLLYFLTVGARSLLMSKRFETWSFTKIFLKTWLARG